MTISILLSFYHVLSHIVMAFLTFRVRSVCAFMRVCLGVRDEFHACNKKFFEGIMLVENEPPCGESWLRVCKPLFDKECCLRQSEYQRMTHV